MASDTSIGNPLTSTTSSTATSSGPSFVPTTNASHSGQLSGRMTHPISSLRPNQNEWVIKVRVMNKSNVRLWRNSKGKFFSMDLCDESGEIRAAAFNEECDKFYNMFEVDKVYYISRCNVKMPKKQYRTLKNDYEMSFTNNTIVEPCNEDDTSVPGVQYNFIPICDIASKETDAIVDVIGVCKDTTDVIEFVSKDGRQLKKREVSMVDQSGSAVSLTLWGEDAVKFDGSQKPVVAVISAFVSEFRGDKTIGMRSSTTLMINPDIPEAHKLRGWYDNGGAQQDITNMSARMNLD